MTPKKLRRGDQGSPQDLGTLIFGGKKGGMRILCDRGEPPPQSLFLGGFLLGEDIPGGGWGWIQLREHRWSWKIPISTENIFINVFYFIS